MFKKIFIQSEVMGFRICYLTRLKLHLEISGADFLKLAWPSHMVGFRVGRLIYFLALILLCVGIHTAGRFSDVTDTFTIIMTNCEWVSSLKYASRLCSSIG